MLLKLKLLNALGLASFMLFVMACTKNEVKKPAAKNEKSQAGGPGLSQQELDRLREQNRPGTEAPFDVPQSPIAPIKPRDPAPTPNTPAPTPNTPAPAPSIQLPSSPKTAWNGLEDLKVIGFDAKIEIVPPKTE